ncbi:hypothetical protein BD626DRAFT_572102 [Schizophyllum amplum]|uniref:DUF6535 domain-containing protein n=1 Tax=Schizophyllum amplum TaxID=97359 RepID=A0A550C5L1_9AGAR|nr:hypothetical protein BD626DRAFT_572102 [Auriculariopsis ampla]
MGSLFRRFLKVCQAPFRGTSPDLGQSWTKNPRFTHDNEGTPKREDLSGSIYHQYRTTRDPTSSGFSANSCASASRDNSEPTPQDVRWYMENNNFSNKPAGEGTAWQECSTLVDKHDTTMCQVWREEIDTLLVFAGLFSAVLTAFIIESYKWLINQPDDLTADYLRQILAIMSNTTITSVPRSNSRPTLPDNIVTLINGLWFSSLTLSLSSALIGIVCKQWLREYLRDAGRSHKTNLAVRQVKYQGLTRWYVGAIITMIPLLLQGALFLFLVGVVYLLWHLQPVVAAIISVQGILIVSFFFATTILPAAQFIVYQSGRLRLHTTAQFPFKSAQAWLFLRLSLMILNFFSWVIHAFASMKDLHFGQPFVAPFQAYAAWPQWDLHWTRRRDESARWSEEPTSVGLCLGFIELNFEHQFLRDWIWNCLWSMRNDAVNAKYVLQCVRRLPKVKANFPSPQDDLAHDVLPLLDPGTESQATTELVSHMLLDPSSEACVEHLIRMYNSLVRRDVQDIPRIVYNSLRVTIYDMPGESSKDTRMQLFLVAQDILRRSQHTEKFLSPSLDLISVIVTHLSRAEVQGGYAFAVEELSLDLGTEVMDWLKRYPNPSRNWRDYQSRVLWSAKTALMLAHRLSGFESIDAFTKWDPRLPSVYALFELVDGKSLLIPPATLPIWTPEKSDMDEFARVKSTLAAACEASSDSDMEVPPGATIRLPHGLSNPRPQRVPSTSSMKSNARQASLRRASFHVVGIDPF